MTPHHPSIPPLKRLLGNPALHMSVIDEALAEIYDTPHLQPDGDPLGGLIGTILSQNTSDVNSSRAYAQLRAQFPRWDDVRMAPRQAIADAIRSGGLAQLKAGRIQKALNALAQNDPELQLAWLSEMPVAEGRAALSALHGVGPKTASCVLLFSLGKAAFPVDTHVYRLSHRIGFASPRATPAAIQDCVEAHLPAERLYPFHVNLIRHGRRVCKAQRPLCDQCALRQLCRYGMASTPT